MFVKCGQHASVVNKAANMNTSRLQTLVGSRRRSAIMARVLEFKGYSVLCLCLQKPILDYLIEYHMLQEDDDLITRFIPRTIMLHHYVEFRLALRRCVCVWMHVYMDVCVPVYLLPFSLSFPFSSVLPSPSPSILSSFPSHILISFPLPLPSPRLQLKVHRESEEGDKGQETVAIWLEFVSDLWERHLPHLREELYGEGLLVYNPNTGCYGFQEEEEEEDEASYSEVMAALLREAAEEDEQEEQVKGIMDSGSFKLQPEDSFAVIDEDVSGHTYDLNQPSSEEEEEDEEEGQVMAGGGEAKEASKEEEEEPVNGVAALSDDCK
jgi:hypothetical protein